MKHGQVKNVEFVDSVERTNQNDPKLAKNDQKPPNNPKRTKNEPNQPVKIKNVILFLIKKIIKLRYFMPVGQPDYQNL